MKKLLSTLAAILTLLLAGVTFAPASIADPSVHPTCSDTDPTQPPCTPPSTCSDTDPTLPPCTVPPCVDSPDRPCPDPTLHVAGPDVAASTCAVVVQTADYYRVQLTAATAHNARVQRLADRRAKTIQRLRAKIRALR